MTLLSYLQNKGRVHRFLWWAHREHAVRVPFSQTGRVTHCSRHRWPNRHLARRWGVFPTSGDCEEEEGGFTIGEPCQPQKMIDASPDYSNKVAIACIRNRLLFVQAPCMNMVFFRGGTLSFQRAMPHNSSLNRNFLGCSLCVCFFFPQRKRT